MPLKTKAGRDGKGNGPAPSGQRKEIVAREGSEVTAPERPKRTPVEKRDFSDALHGELAACLVYEVLFKTLTKSDVLAERAIPYALNLVKKMNPRDAFETMAVQQALWTHARLARLSMLAVSQTSLEGTRILNEACDRATNTFRRLMLAFAGFGR